jgi:PAS domain S-box-containing protein
MYEADVSAERAQATRLPEWKRAQRALRLGGSRGMNERSLKVLLVEDERLFAPLFERFLQEFVGLPVELRHAVSLAEGLDHLKAVRYDVALLDLGLPDSDGLATYRQIKAHAARVPVVVLTANVDASLALQAVREGAEDYLFKTQLDAMTLGRVVRYAFERRQAQEELRQREEFFRLISENVTDLIAVVDANGRRVYNSPSYHRLLGDPSRLIGTDSFEEVHPDDRDRIMAAFRETLSSGLGRRAEYRLISRDGSTRYIESVGSVIRDEWGCPRKVVVVSRDITEHKENVELLRQALSDLNRSHEALKTAQTQLVQAEKLEAVSTFAAGVAHEVKNPLQTIILGVDFLTQNLSQEHRAAGAVLRDMSQAVLRADAILRGMQEFAAGGQREMQDESLSTTIELALRAVQNELAQFPVRLVKELAADLPPLRVDPRRLRHAFISLFLYSIRSMSQGGELIVRTCLRPWQEEASGKPRGGGLFKAGDLVAVAEVEERRTGEAPGEPAAASAPSAPSAPKGLDRASLGLTVIRKIIELFGGRVQTIAREALGMKYIITFRTQLKASI